MKKSNLKQLMLLALVAITSISLFSCTSNQETTEESSNFGGLALYTLRNDMGQNVDSTLQAVADAGYINLEAAGYAEGKYYGMEPAEFKALVESKGLKLISTHQSSATLENIEIELAAAKAAGFQYFVIPVPPMGMFKYDPAEGKIYMEGTAKDLVNILNQMGEKANAAGLKLLYHNHHFEFDKDSEGNMVMDYLLENVNPELVNFQMDLYWVTKAEHDPIAYMEKYQGRFKSWHIKDMDTLGRFAPVGTGTIDFGKILEHKDQSGMEYYFVEQDQTFDEMTAQEAINISHEGLKKFGFK